MTKLSFTTMGTPDWDAVQAIKAAAKYGYNGIDLRISSFKGELTLQSSDQDIATVVSCLQDHHIKPAGLLCYNEVIKSADDSGQEMKESLIAHLEMGLKLGSPAIRMFGGNPFADIPTGDFIRKTAEVVHAALESVDEKIDIVLQNHVGSYTATAGVELIRMVNNPRFGLVFSPDHCIIMEEKMDEVYPLVKPYSKQLYISDVVFYEENGETKHKGILPGKGCTPICDSYAALGGDEFDGFVSFKWEKLWQQHLEEPDVALPYFIDFWQNWVEQQ